MPLPYGHDRSIPWIARVLLDTGASGVALLEGPEFTFSYVNRSFQDLAPERPFMGRPLSQVWPEITGELVPVLERVRETGQPLEAKDLRLDVLRSGKREPAWFSFALHPVAERAGDPVAIAVRVAERTGAVLAQEREGELRAGRERLLETERARDAAQQLAESIPQLVWIADAQGHADWFNQRWFQYTGLDPQSSRGGGLSSIVHPDDAQRARARWAVSVASGEPFDIEYRLRRADGAHRWHLGRAVPLRGGDGRILEWLGTCTDIDDQKRAQEEVQRARGRAEEAAHAEARRAAELFAVLDSIPDALVLHDGAGRVVRTNAAADRILGYGGEVGRRTGDPGAGLHVFRANGQRLPPEDMPVVRALRGDEVRGMELRLEREGAAPVWLSASAAPIRGQDGELHGVVTIMTDITSIHALQEQREDLIRAISHDLRTPLTVVMAQSQMLARRPDEPATVVRRADSIRTSAARMATMIGDLVDVVRLEAGQVAVEPRPVALAPFAAELRDRLRGALPVERLRLEVPEALPPVLADPPRLERILVNLIANALKYSPPETEAILSADRQDERIRITVTDRGPGISPDEVPYLFDRFWRSPSVLTKKEGLGLGLHITRLLVEAHGGDIAVESVLGKGSAFHVRLPAAV